MNADEVRDEFEANELANSLAPSDCDDDGLMGANAEIDMLRHVIERLTGGTVEAAVKTVVSWDRADMEMIRAQQEAALR